MFDVYAVKDLKKGIYAQPFFVPQGTPREHVIINFERALKSGQSEIYFNPEDFELHCLGWFESTTGKLLCDGEPELVVKASTILDGLKVKLKGEDDGESKVN